MTHSIDHARRFVRPLGLAAVIALAGGAAMAQTDRGSNQRIIDALTARGFSDIQIDHTGSVIRVDAERRGTDYDFVYDPDSGKLTVRDGDERMENENAKSSRVVELLKREGFRNIEINQTGAVYRGEATRGGLDYDFMYNIANGKLSVERDGDQSASANPGNGGNTGQARAHEVRDDRGGNGRGDDGKGKDDKGKGRDG